MTYTANIYYYITTTFEYAKRNSYLAAYGGVVLQQFEFIKVCMGMQGFALKVNYPYIYLPCCCVLVFFNSLGIFINK